MLTKKGNLKIGQVVIQRKGGDAGKDTANMLQFKFGPCLRCLVWKVKKTKA